MEIPKNIYTLNSSSLNKFKNTYNLTTKSNLYLDHLLKEIAITSNKSSLKIVSSEQINSYTIGFGELRNGALLEKETQFTAFIGGKENGFSLLTLNLPKSGFYELAIEYVSADFNRSLKIDINGIESDTTYKVPITTGWLPSDSKIFSISANLRSGYNTIKFYGETNAYAPKLGIVTLIFKRTISTPYSSYNANYITSTYNTTMGLLLNDTQILENINLVGFIGGPKDGSSQVSVNVDYKGVYYLTIQYLSTEFNRTFKVDVNNIVNDIIYSPPATDGLDNSDISSFTFPVILESGRNTLKFHGDGTNYSPDLGQFTLDLPPITENLSQGILEGFAKVDANNKFLEFPLNNDSSSTISLDISTAGDYNLIFKYMPLDTPSFLNIDINGINNNSVYNFEKNNISNDTAILTFTVPIYLNSGNNTIKFYNYKTYASPKLSTICLEYIPQKTLLFSSQATTFTTPQDSYNLIDGDISGSAVIDKVNNLLTWIGGPKDGASTIKVYVNYTGTYIIRISYINNNRPLKIDVNNVSGTIYNINGAYADIFATPLNLVAGINTLKFHGDGINYAPDLSEFTLSLNESRIASAPAVFDGILSENASFLSSGGVTGLGGFEDESYSMTYFANVPGVYSLTLTVNTSKWSNLAIDINESEDPTIYYIPKRTTPIDYAVKVNLKQGNNLIVFHGDGINYAPDLLNINFALDSAIPSNSIYSLSKNVDLKNGAFLDPETNFVQNLGGIDDGSVSITVNVSSAGLYNLYLEFEETETDSPLLIDIDGINTGSIYNLPMTGFQVADDSEFIAIPLSLKAGNNILTFHGNGSDSVSSLGSFYLLPSSANNFQTLATFNQTYSLKTASLISGAKSHPSLPGFIYYIGGPNDGLVQLSLNNIPIAGEYTLAIKYITDSNSKDLFISVNGISTSIPYNPPLTKSTTIDAAEILLVDFYLNAPKNTIEFYGNGINFTPMLGDVTITDSSANRNTPYRINSVDLQRGAKRYAKGEFIAGIGGRKDGAATVKTTVSSTGLYDLSFKYIAPNENRANIRIKLNGKSHDIYTLPLTNDFNPNNARTFTIPFTLVSGNNQIKFKGLGTEQAPLIGEFKLIPGSSQSIYTYNLANGTLTGNAQVTGSGLVQNIGGPKKGAVSIKVNVFKAGSYNLELEYASKIDIKKLIVLVNNIYLNNIFELYPVFNYSLSNLPTFSIQIKLITGINTITFQGDGTNNYGPLLRNFTLTLITPPEVILPPGSYSAASGILEGGASINSDSGFVTNLGGQLNGACTITVNVEDTGYYNMTVEYIQQYDSSYFTFSVNGVEQGIIYILQGKLYTRNYESFEIFLKANSNTIKFYGNENNDLPDIGVIKIDPVIIDLVNP